MFDKKMESNKRKNIPSVCKGCSDKPCKKLYWKNVVVLPDHFAAPFDCPLRVKDEDGICSALSSLSDYDVSRMAGEVCVKHNFGPRYVNGNNKKAENIDHIISHFRRNLCVVLSKRAAPDFKPWSQTGSLSHDTGFGYGMPPVLDRGKKNEESVTNAIIDEEAGAENLPLEIKNLRWEHTDEQLRKESPDFAGKGDTLKLLADFENFVEGAGVDFYVSDRSSGTKKQLKNIHTRCKKMAAEVEWEVDVSKAGEETDIIFEVEARSLLSEPCEIKIEEREEITRGFYSVQFIDWKNKKIRDISCKITRDDEEIFNGKLSEGAFVLKEVSGVEVEAHITYKDKVHSYILPWTSLDDKIFLIKIVDNLK